MNDKISRVQFALGLAQKAGKLASGDVAVRSALKSRKVQILLIAEDAAPNTKRELHHLAETSGVKVKEILTAAQIGAAIGRAKRVSAAVLDVNFYNMLGSII